MSTAPKREFGIDFPHTDPAHRKEVISYLNVKLATHGHTTVPAEGAASAFVNAGLVANFRQKNRLLYDYLPPADQRIQQYLDTTLSGVDSENEIPRLPGNTFVLDQYGLARELSLPADADDFHTDIVHSYRTKQGVLHNPKHDRRTTKGVFHVAEGGLPVPHDKKEVPKIAFLRLLKAALNPPDELARFPFTSNFTPPASGFISLLLKPMVQPEVAGTVRARYTEIRFLAPGTLVSNLDFVESIFGNAGDPYLPENDSALDPAHWTGHTGCIILATHLLGLRKKDLGLPNVKDATPRQKHDGMCWEDADELYNDGTPFKITCRDERGIIVTLVADNYFGYSKKEVKTQISYSANLMGLAEEEHAGGALAFPAYSLGMKFVPEAAYLNTKGQTLADISKYLGDRVEMHDGYATDTNYPQIVYLPEDAEIDLETQKASWTNPDGTSQTLHVLPGKFYIHPTGYKVHMEQHPGSGMWRLVGTTAEGTLCHKPCTVSGGGKSEISKSIVDAMHFTPLIIADYRNDMDLVEKIITRDYSDRHKHKPNEPGRSRTILSPDRSLGSVIKLLTPSPRFTDEYNTWLRGIPHRIRALVFLVKRFYKQEWGEDWRSKFSVDVVNGSPGNILKFLGRPILGSYLRVGLRSDGTGWTHKLRQDFMPSRKVQWEDDISASIVLPTSVLTGLNADYKGFSVKFVENCEFRFFQRPDEAIHRGYDKQAEYDLSTPPVFASNFEPFKKGSIADFVEQTIPFSEYTKPVQELLLSVRDDENCTYFMVSSHPRIFDGAPSKNPRYLQTDPAQLFPMERYLADVGGRLHRQVPANEPVLHPINAVLPGRRNNPPDHKAGIRPLAVYGPIHYQELPELFMDFVSSLTGKSPSTTGAGSEGALTKGPFNALVPTTDLNNALLSYILTGYEGFSSAAGYIGPDYRVDHDVSLLIPEIWSRLEPRERDPEFLISNGYFEKVHDFEHKGKKVFGSRLGYRMTAAFTADYFGRIFDSPDNVFNDEMLKPELQGLDDYVDGINNIVETQQRVAKAYLDDGSVNGAIPPLQALLHIMAEGSYQGMEADDPSFRAMFDRDTVLASDWYQARIDAYQTREAAYLEREIEYIQRVMNNGSEVNGDIAEALEFCRIELDKVRSEAYRNSLIGTIGLDALYRG
ncbi:MAG: hypothetical protein ACOC4I_02105 [Spirochaetota bacterium]